MAEYARWSVLLKLPLNGFVNLLFAELLLGFSFFSRLLSYQNERPLRWILIHAFMLATTLPLLISGWIHGKTYEDSQYSEITNEMYEMAKAIRTHIQDYLQQHTRAIITLSASVDRDGDFGFALYNVLIEVTL